jgi:hypothetical protein
MEALKIGNIKTILSILKTIDKEERSLSIGNIRQISSLYDTSVLCDIAL